MIMELYKEFRSFWAIVYVHAATRVFNNSQSSGLRRNYALSHERETTNWKPLLLIFILNSYSIRVCFGICFNTQFVFNSLFISFQFIWFRLQLVIVHSIIHSINRFIVVTSLYPVKLDFVHRLLYTCCTLLCLDLLCACRTISYFIAYSSFCQSR